MPTGCEKATSRILLAPTSPHAVADAFARRVVPEVGGVDLVAGEKLLDVALVLRGMRSSSSSAVSARSLLSMLVGTRRSTP